MKRLIFSLPFLFLVLQAHSSELCQKAITALNPYHSERNISFDNTGKRIKLEVGKFVLGGSFDINKSSEVGFGLARDPNATAAYTINNTYGTLTSIAFKYTGVEIDPEDYSLDAEETSVPMKVEISFAWAPACVVQKIQEFSNGINSRTLTNTSCQNLPNNEDGQKTRELCIAYGLVNPSTNSVIVPTNSASGR